MAKKKITRTPIKKVPVKKAAVKKPVKKAAIKKTPVKKAVKKSSLSAGALAGISQALGPGSRRTAQIQDNRAAEKIPKTAIGSWQSSVEANPSRKSKPWKTKEGGRASSKKRSTSATGVNKSTKKKAVTKVGKTTSTKGSRKKAKGAKIRSSKKAKR